MDNTTAMDENKSEICWYYLDRSSGVIEFSPEYHNVTIRIIFDLDIVGYVS